MCVTNIIKNLTCFQGVFVIKNYRLTLISLLVSCSLLNAMENGNADTGQYLSDKAKTISIKSRQIVDYLKSKYRPTEIDEDTLKKKYDCYNIYNYESYVRGVFYELYSIPKYRSNKFNVKKDLFVKSIIELSCDEPSKYLPPSYINFYRNSNNLQRILENFFTRSKQIYMEKLFRDWTKAKKADYNLFIKTIINSDSSNNTPNQEAIKHLKIKDCMSCMKMGNELIHTEVVTRHPYKDGKNITYVVIKGRVSCVNKKFIKDRRDMQHNLFNNKDSRKVISKEVIERKYPIGKADTQCAMDMWE